MIQSNIDLRPYNTFGVSVTARYFVDIQTPDQFSKLMQDPIFQNTANKLFLGGGSNLLLTQDFDGLVIHNSIDTMRIISLDGDTMKVMVGGGVIRHDFVMRAAERSRRGAENLALIPGTVGAAPVQNIGAYGVEVKDVITSVKGFDLTTRDIRALNPIECHFGYRDSVFKHELKDKFFITHVTFQLSKNPSPRLEYKGLEDLQSKA
ncbi:MAG: FAD-binding protein [Candidatus Peribacteria bacterium]|nr:MAG: FAD-binding protein [Candidatus Peribacteria bacterium]